MAQVDEKLDLVKELATYENLVHAISGLVGGVTAISAFYPLNNIRSRIQLDDSIEKGSMLHVTKQIVGKYGWYGLFQGWWSAVVCLGASNFVYFYTYNAFKTIYQVKVLGSRKKGIDAYNNLVIAALAGVVNVMLTTPLWVVNTRLTVQDTKKKGYDGVWDCLTRIAREEGWEKLWAGVTSGLMLVSNPSIHFVVYDKLRGPMMKWAEANKHSGAFVVGAVGFIVGAIAKSVATVVTYPIQTAQAKMRNDKEKKYKGTLHCLSVLYQQDGWKAWFRGMEAKLWQTVLTAAFQFMTYEQTNKFVTDLLMGDRKVTNAPSKGH
jgi:adenine nucleotide transporter 17